MPVTPAELMQLAIAQARAGIAAGQSPFGCAIAHGDQVIAVAHNRVLQTTDITAHAEVVALREGCRALNAIHLENCLVATTCEPCPMCMAALHWARVQTVHFGATIADASQAGFNELHLSAADVVRIGRSPIQLIGDTLADQCRQLFAEWLATPRHRAY